MHINQEGVDMGVGPFTHGSAKHTDIMKTQSLKMASTNTALMRLLAPAAMRKKSRAKERVFLPR